MPSRTPCRKLPTPALKMRAAGWQRLKVSSAAGKRSTAKTACNSRQHCVRALLSGSCKGAQQPGWLGECRQEEACRRRQAAQPYLPHARLLKAPAQPAKTCTLQSNIPLVAAQQPAGCVICAGRCPAVSKLHYNCAALQSPSHLIT